MPTIKRYSNRKLYDTHSKQYVTLDDVAEMVRAGEEVRIVDHDSGEDITTLSLFQILFEEEKRIGGLVSQMFLTRMIRSGSEALEQVRKSFSRPTRNGGDTDAVDQEIEHRVQSLVLSGSVSPQEGARILELLVPPIPSEPEPAPALERTPEAALDNGEPSVVSQLIEQLDRLEAELENLRQQRGA